MAGTLVGNADDGGRSNEHILNFSNGQRAGDPGLTKHQRDILRFTSRQFGSQIDRDHAIEQKFGFDANTYVRKLEELKNHSDLTPRMQKRLEEAYGRTKELEEAYSRPPSGLGPMKGGTPIKKVGRQFVAEQEPFQ